MSPRPIPSLDTHTPTAHDVVIVGGGAAGIAVAASLLRREPALDVLVVDPADEHFYQPGWTMVGGGVFELASTRRRLADVIPRGAQWLKAAVTAFEPERHAVVLADGGRLRYRQLVVCPGLALDWDGVEGLAETLGRNSVTSNYRADLAPYTWQLVRNWRGGRALFTQPPLPIKCAGAPQKAMYLSCDAWRRAGTLRGSEVRFMNAGAALFGVAAYVPALMEYVEAYGIGLRFGHRLGAVAGDSRKATFERSAPDGSRDLVVERFDLLHAVPPQVAPAFVRASPLADAAGWLELDPATLRHARCADVFGLGDAGNTPNAKTAAAVRRQAPVVAHNVLAALGRARGEARYDGYGACPLTVERGRVVLAEFAYGGRLAPSLPRWAIEGTRPSRAAWRLKADVLPRLYWNAMLKGREWLAAPELVR